MRGDRIIASYMVKTLVKITSGGGGGQTSTVVFERPKLVHSSGGRREAPAGGKENCFILS